MINYITATEMFNHLKNFIDAYNKAMEPLEKEMRLPQTAVDILMFLANNPQHYVARDICKYRHLKPGIVSMHIENLVRGGYLERRPVPGDRRQWRLVCCDKANPIIDMGRDIQRKFVEAIISGVSEQDLKIYKECIGIFDKNIEKIRQEGIS